MTNRNELYEATFYYALCNLMADFMYEKWNGHTLNVRKVKLLSNQLKGELEKSIDVLFNRSTDGVDFAKVGDQFINATQIMEDFFMMGLKMDELPEDQKEEMNNKINAIIKTYLPDETR